MRPTPFPALAGFTLLELLLVIAVLAISLQLSTVSFAPQLREMRSAAAMNHVAGLMAYARHEALLRRTPVTVCVLNNTCDHLKQLVVASVLAKAVQLDQINSRRLPAFARVGQS